MVIKKKHISIIVLVFIIVLVLVFPVRMWLTPAASYCGVNLMFCYDGETWNGGIDEFYEDDIVLDWQIDTYGYDYWIHNWLMYIRIQDPGGSAHSDTFYGSGILDPDTITYFTTDFGEIYDMEGEWTMYAATLEGDLYDADGNLIEEGEVVDHIGESIPVWVHYNLEIDYSVSAAPNSVEEGEPVTLSYDTTNTGDSCAAHIIEAWCDKNENDRYDTGEKTLLGVWDEEIPVGSGLTGFTSQELYLSDCIPGTTTVNICWHIHVYEIQPNCGTIWNHFYDYWEDDYIAIEIVNDPPYTPGDPYPTNGQTSIPLSGALLSWSGGDPDGDSVTYYVYFDTNTYPTTLVSTQVDDTNWNTGGLAEDTVYYWRIEASDGIETTYGPTWLFTTGDELPNQPPVITEDSGNVNVMMNQQVTLWVKATDDFGVTSATISIDGATPVAMSYDTFDFRWEYTYIAPSEGSPTISYVMTVYDDEMLSDSVSRQINIDYTQEPSIIDKIIQLIMENWVLVGAGIGCAFVLLLMSRRRPPSSQIIYQPPMQPQPPIQPGSGYI
jgi:hypothetical protein